MLRGSLLISAVALSAAEIADPEWAAFKTAHQKIYHSAQEEQSRHEIFMESKARIERLNELNGQPVFGITWMSDRIPEERFKTGLKKPEGFVPTAPVKEFGQRRNPSSIDWRFTDAVTSIKNQGQCGSCWAFSATEAIESQLSLTSGGKYNLELSPQQVTSCTPTPAEGCNGGFTEAAYDYVKSVAGLANSFFIPYQQSLTEPGNTKACPNSKVSAIAGPYEKLQGGYASISGYSYATKPCTSGSCEHQDLDALAAALEESPVSVCVNAGSWNDYTGGVMTSAACGSMGAADQDHCVMAVGFNTTAPTPYWIVRNSWADTWGEQGYIYLEMAKNTCGLADDATIPEVTVDMTEVETSEAATRREAMYQFATGGFPSAVKSIVV
jgi:C1A family cysteine protease